MKDLEIFMRKKYSDKDKCPCCSLLKFKECCKPYLEKLKTPQTAEQLMRSRYTAFFLNDFAYIEETMRENALKRFSLKDAISQAKNCKWTGLKVVEHTRENDSAFVEFVAEYSSYGKVFSMREKSLFKKIEGQWFYVDAV